jgi:hypothetical protein
MPALKKRLERIEARAGIPKIFEVWKQSIDDKSDNPLMSGPNDQEMRLSELRQTDRPDIVRFNVLYGERL